MKKKKDKINFQNLVATDGFEFSGSGLINDIFRDSGYFVPKNIRADEFLYWDNNFSWPKALNKEYSFLNRIILLLNLLKTIFFRIPLNFIQKTPIYKKYLFLKGRGVEMHQPTSVNRSLRSYFLSMYMIIFNHNYDERTFKRWFFLKYKNYIDCNANLLIDNGIPKDKRIIDWFFRINGSLGIFVYRNPRIQYQQIIEVSRSTGKILPTYYDFLKGLQSQYISILWMLDLNHKIIFISFDEILDDMNYRNKIEIYFKKMKILEKLIYDFTDSIRNNNDLSFLSKDLNIDSKSVELEKIINGYHDLFKDNLYDSIQG